MRILRAGARPLVSKGRRACVAREEKRDAPEMGWQSKACTSWPLGGICCANAGRSACAMGLPFQVMRAVGA